MASRPQEITEDRLLAMVARMCAKPNSQDKAARVLGITQSFLSDVLHRKRPLGLQIPRYFGYERVVRYRKVEQ